MESTSFSKTKDARDSQQFDTLESLKRAQIADRVEMVPCNINSDYEIPEHDEDNYLVIKTLIKNVQGNKNILEEKAIIKVHKDGYKEFETHAKSQYDSYEIIHDPRSSAEKSTSGSFGTEAEQGKRAKVKGQVNALKENHEKVLNEKDQQIASLSQAVDDNEKAKLDAEAALKAKDKEIEALKKKLAESPKIIESPVTDDNSGNTIVQPETTQTPVPSKKGKGA